MGPSGSGKTTLLTALAGRVPAGSKLSLTGRLTVNGSRAAEADHKQAFVQQDDLFFSQLTVREVMRGLTPVGWKGARHRAGTGAASFLPSPASPAAAVH